MTGTRFFAPHLGKTIFLALCLATMPCLGASAWASGDLPLADSSPIAGIPFEQKPMVLPVQRNFQMAMLTASSALRRSCGKIESYGWRMGPNDQDRVNAIFNDTVDRLRAQGFTVESQSAKTIAKDVTLFTADRADKNLIFMWSAGDIGLVAVLCETSRPLGQRLTDEPDQASVDQPTDLRLPTGQKERPPEAKAPMGLYAASKATTPPMPMRFGRAGREVYANFSPLGAWEGTYTCAQGTTGATLHIKEMKGEHFTGEFSFYPTAKNPSAASGSYTVSGDYDIETSRILINPGQWIVRPDNYFNTVIIGSFDPTRKTLSAYFQGIMGCTSFEAKVKETTSAESLIQPPSASAEKQVVKNKQTKKAKTPPKKSAKKKTTPQPKATPTTAPLPTGGTAPLPVTGSLPSLAPPAAIKITK